MIEGKVSGDGCMFRNLGYALGLLRELRGQSQAAVAKRAGIGKSQLSKYENGRELPKLDSLEKVLNVLGIGHEGFFSTLAIIDDWATAMGGEEGTAVSFLPPVPVTGFTDLDQAFKTTLCDLFGLQRSLVEVVLRTVACGIRPSS